MDALRTTYEYLAAGGPMMGLLFLSSLLCVTIVAERARALRRERILPARLCGELESLIREKKTSEALALSRASDASVARVFASGLVEIPNTAEVQEAMETAGRHEAARMEKNLNALGTLAAVGPLLGLLGTVTGMIRTFGVIRITGVGDPMKLSGGISEALLCTAAGMVVGIPALVFHRYFAARVDGFLTEMEEFSARMMKFLRPG